MNPQLKGVWEHIRELGLGALAHANRHAAYYDSMNDRWPELSVLQAAHSAELLIKARIAQEHPLLIFDTLPKSSQSSGATLDLADLFERGRTVQWNDLPERLWAATGVEITDVDAFISFGKLRNGIQHFGATPGVDPSDETLIFIFETIDPLIHDWWELFAVDYDEDSDPYIYFVPALITREILFNVSPSAAALFKNWDVDWDNVPGKYRNEIEVRAHAAITSNKMQQK